MIVLFILFRAGFVIIVGLKKVVKKKGDQSFVTECKQLLSRPVCDSRSVTCSCHWLF